MQRWKKLGCIFKSESQTESINSHTAMPQAYHLYDDIFILEVEIKIMNQV